MDERVPWGVLSSEGMDRVLAILPHRQRRLILFMLARGEPVTESGLEVRGSRDPDGSNRGLRHVHLPKLAEAGYIEWDRETGAIGKGPRFDEVEPLLDLIETRPDELPPNWP